MSWPGVSKRALGALLLAGTVTALGAAVIAAARGPEDWFELGVIGLAVIAGVSLRGRARRAPRREHRIRRTADSRW